MEEPAWNCKAGALSGGNDLAARECTLDEAKAVAILTEGCVGFTIESCNHATFTGKKFVYFKSSAGGNDDPAWQTWLIEGGPTRLCNHRRGAIGAGNTIFARECGFEAAKALAVRTDGCLGFTFEGKEAEFEGERCVFFKSSTLGNDDPAWQTFVVARPQWLGKYIELLPATKEAVRPEDTLPPVTDYLDHRLTLDMIALAVVPPDSTAVLPLPIGAYPCVTDEAIRIAAHVASQMLLLTPLPLRERLCKGEACIGVIGVEQRTSDIPAHRFLRRRDTFDGRSFDAGCRGVGGQPGCACTSVGEENLLMLAEDGFGEESILVHEFAHGIMNLGLTEEQQDEVDKLYETATDDKRRGELGYLGEASSTYMLQNPDEFWAEASQAWFGANARRDVNCGLRTRDEVRARVPGLADLLTRVYGAGEWQYVSDCPHPWPHHPLTSADARRVEAALRPPRASLNSPRLDGAAAVRRAFRAHRRAAVFIQRLRRGSVMRQNLRASPAAESPVKY